MSVSRSMFFFSASGPRHIGLGGNDLLHAEIGEADLHLAAFHLGQVEDVVDHFQQGLARLLDVLHVAFLLVVQGVDAGQDLAEAQDAVQRRAELVAHGGQEVALDRVHLVQPHVHLGQFIDLAVEVHVGLPQLLLNGDERPQHAVEGRREFLEFIAGMDLGPQINVAAGHGVAHVAQMPQGFDDHVADDGIRGEHGKKDGHERTGPENA